jgi:hypothetical protein
MARNFDCQVAQFQVRIDWFNAFNARDIPVTKGREISLSGAR